MNYHKVYNMLVENAKNRTNVSGYTEKHHIIPKSFGGSNDDSNLVIFTGREHFIAHRLLAKMYPESGMVHAIFKMICVSKKRKANSRLYAYLRKEHSKRVSEDKIASMKKSLSAKGKKQSIEHIVARTTSRKKNGVWLSEEAKNNISLSLKGKPSRKKGKKHSSIAEIEGHRKAVKTRKANGSYKRTLEMNLAVSKALSGRPANRPPLSSEAKLLLKKEKSKTVSCPHCKKEGQCMVMYRWHFDNCKQLGRSVEI